MHRVQPRTGDVVVGRRTIGNQRVTGTLSRFFRDGQALLTGADGSTYTVWSDTLIRPLAR